MLDVLGFSQRLNSREQIESLAKQYNSLIAEAKRTIFTSGTVLGSVEPQISNFEVGEFVFDNLVLVSHPVTPTTASQFSLALMRLMQRFASEHMPLRGAIGVGDYYSDAETKVFLSDIFKKLSREEGLQNWSGCVLLEDAAEFIIEAVSGPGAELMQTQSSAYLRMAVPAKEELGQRWCLNWMYSLSQTQREHVMSFLKGDIDKYDGTRGYLEKLDSLPETISPLAPEFLPAVAIKAVLTRGAAQIQFVNAAGESVEPGIKEFTLGFIGH